MSVHMPQAVRTGNNEGETLQEPYQLAGNNPNRCKFRPQHNARISQILVGVLITVPAICLSA